jgi:hypothetical protein
MLLSRRRLFWFLMILGGITVCFNANAFWYDLSMSQEHSVDRMDAAAAGAAAFAELHHHHHASTKTRRVPSLGDDEHDPLLHTNLPICDEMNSPARTYWWAHHGSNIVAASQHPLDTQYVLQNLTRTIFYEIAPRIHRSIQTLPSSSTIMQHSTPELTSWIQKLDRRYQYLLHPDAFSVEPPPVQITVLGGSVTMGVNC